MFFSRSELCLKLKYTIYPEFLTRMLCVFNSGSKLLNCNMSIGCSDSLQNIQDSQLAVLSFDNSTLFVERWLWLAVDVSPLTTSHPLSRPPICPTSCASRVRTTRCFCSSTRPSSLSACALGSSTRSFRNCSRRCARSSSASRTRSRQ